MKAHFSCCDSTAQQSRKASFPRFHYYLSRDVRCTCFIRRRAKLIRTAEAPSCAFLSNKESWAPWRASITGADLSCRHVRNITRRTAWFSGKGLFFFWCLSAGSDLWGWVGIETHQPHVVHTVLPRPYGNIYVVFVVQRSKRRRSISVDFMTRFSKFTAMGVEVGWGL